jgi:hypothetical protein
VSARTVFLVDVGALVLVWGLLIVSSLGYPRVTPRSVALDLLVRPLEGDLVVISGPCLLLIVLGVALHRRIAFVLIGWAALGLWLLMGARITAVSTM